MGQRLVCDWIVPCIICEDPVEHVTVKRDDETGTEETVRVRLPHMCDKMWTARSERPSYYRTGPRH